MANLLFKEIGKTYPSGIAAVTDFDLDVGNGEFIVFAGPAGCGKSTILRMVAGLEDVSEGELYIDGKQVNDVPSKDRDVAMVSQNRALYPHMTVYENLAFGLKLRKVAKSVIDERVKEAAAILGITDCLGRKPRTLTAGQRQRVALGRAIVREPKAFLLDEPLSNLDPKLRVQMRTEISKLHARLAATTTFLYATHDQVEAMTMGTRIAVMKDGFLQQVDTPQNLYDYPVNRFVAGYIGSPQMNFFPAVLSERENKLYVEFQGNCILLPKTVAARLKNAKEYVNTGKTVTLGVRPEDVHDEENFLAASPDTVVKAYVEIVEKLGAETLVCCKLDYREGEKSESIVGGVSNMVARIDSRSNVARGEIAEFALDARHIHLFDTDTELSLLERDEGYEKTPENEAAASYVPPTPREMRAILDKNRAVSKEEKAAVRREARVAAKREKAEAKAAPEERGDGGHTADDGE